MFFLIFARKLALHPSLYFKWFLYKKVLKRFINEGLKTENMVRQILHQGGPTEVYMEGSFNYLLQEVFGDGLVHIGKEPARTCFDGSYLSCRTSYVWNIKLGDAVAIVDLTVTFDLVGEKTKAKGVMVEVNPIMGDGAIRDAINQGIREQKHLPLEVRTW